MQRVFGIDPGYGRCGLAIVEKDNEKERVVFSSCIETDPKTSFPERLKMVGDEITHIIDLYLPESIALEEVFFSNNQKTALRVAEVRGMIIYIALSKKIPLFEYNPGRVKVAITGQGNSGKQEVMKMIKLLTKIDKPDILDDEYDAIGLALTSLAERKHAVS